MTINAKHIEVAKELAERQCEALRIFRLLPTQTQALQSVARETLLRGGNRSLVAETEVWIDGSGKKTLADTVVGDSILAVNVDYMFQGRRKYRSLATIVGRSEFDEETFTLTTTSGSSLCGIAEHPLLCCPPCDSGPDVESLQWVDIEKVCAGWYAERVLESGFRVYEMIESVIPSGKRKIVGITTDLSTYIGNGFVNHNSGKSMSSAARFAAIAMDRPIYSAEGKAIDLRLPWQKGRCLTMWAIGYGEDHIGQTIYRLLFKAGAFKMIRDLKTGQWRAFRPWDKSDQSRQDQVKPSPPLIPPRYIKPGDANKDSFVWTNKGARVFDRVTIWDPITKEDLAEIYAYTSSGEVKAGDPVDEIWIDEAIKYPSHYAEWQARLIDRKGRIWWSSWPQVSNNALMEITSRAREQIGEDHPSVREFILTMSGNPHLPEESKRDAIRGWSPEERMARDRGEYTTDSLKMYPKFSKDIHSAILVEDKEDDISRALRHNGNMPPEDWTRELILDPGTSHPAVLLCAIPPPSMGEFLIPYDEIYIRNLDADQLADVIEKRTQGQYFNRFIIDWHAARQTPMSFGKTIEANYSQAFEKRGLRCHQTGSWFSYGSDNVSGRIMTLQNMMTLRPGGKPVLRIVTENCKELVKQLENYLKKVTGGQVSEMEPAKNQHIDLAVALEYWVASAPQWVPYSRSVRNLSRMHNYFLELKSLRRKQDEEQEETIHLGPWSASVN